MKQTAQSINMANNLKQQELHNCTPVKFTFRDLYNNIKSVEKPRNWADVRYENSVFFVEILENYKEGMRISVENNLEVNITYNNQPISWITFDQVQSVENVSGIIKLLNGLKL